MDKSKAGQRVVPVECFINTGTEPAPLDAESGRRILPGGGIPGLSGSAAAPITYSQYMGSIERYLCKNSHRALKNLLKKQGFQSPSSSFDAESHIPAFETILRIELISEKHGAFYSVSRLRLYFADEVRSFAINCAFSTEQQAFLKVESKLNAKLNSRFGLPHIPIVFLCAKTTTDGAGGEIMLSISGWFDGHHEFHLSPNDSGAPVLKVWAPSSPQCLLSEAETVQLYEQASAILTSYLDTRSFSQIYPWHHAAGDFVVDRLQNPLSLKLITVRGYRPLLAAKSVRTDKMLASLHFFVNLSIRMRIDRLDGTGDLVWAGPQALRGVVRGFRRAWKGGPHEDRDLPKAREIFSLFLDLSPEERLAFAEAAAADGRVEADEGDFLLLHLPRHVIELSDALADVLSLREP
jgi:hypothetical protein